jgi:serine protease Do
MEVAPVTPQLAQELRAPSADGVVIVRLARGPAYEAGLESGDIIVAVNGQRISDGSQLVKLIADAPIGGSVTLEFLRDGRRQTVKVVVQRLEDRRRVRRNG